MIERRQGGLPAEADGVPSPGHEAAGDALLEIPVDRLLEDWKEAYAGAVAYLEALRVPEGSREDLARGAIQAAAGEDWRGEGDDAARAIFRNLRRLIMRTFPIRDEAGLARAGTAQGFLRWRLGTWLAGGPEGHVPAALGSALKVEGSLPATPPIERGPMVPERIERHGVRMLGKRLSSLFPQRDDQAGIPGVPQSTRAPRDAAAWRRVAGRRRVMLLILVVIPSIAASGFMASVLPHRGGTALESVIVLFFGALFGWISIGFWTALVGFVMLLRGGDRFLITRAGAPAGAPAGTPDRATEARTAILMPICNEPVQRVFAGIEATFRSLSRTGRIENFDFFVLSDTRDPDLWVREEEAWAESCRRLEAFGRLFYRRRKIPLKRKSGNVADFCRRWGRRYRYLIPLDADSVMGGETVVHLVDLMERHPDAGIIQTAPRAVGRQTLFARVQQFAAAAYGPLFAAGLHFWQLGDGQYWGHNAIIRVKPFMAHCGLARLPGAPPLGGEIMSHDFVEAALLGRAGHSLWLAYDLPGSYEEVPSTLLEEMKRDRRWCQGNLQHLRLLFTEGLFPAHRALFINGVMSYGAALLWFAFLLLSTAEAIAQAVLPPEYFPLGRSLFPEWPVWHLDRALSLMAVTGVILFLPKLLGIALIVLRRQARAFGGILALCAGCVIEMLLSALLAPIRMVFHSRFLITNLLGREVKWVSQRREESETAWREALRAHGLDTLAATLWGAGLHALNPGYFWWLAPIIAALLLSVPLSVLASRVRAGLRAQQLGLLLIPEEFAPPGEIRELQRRLGEMERARPERREREGAGFVRAITDPYANALHRVLLRGPRRLHPRILAARRALAERALRAGPEALSPRERIILLTDGDRVDALHDDAWRAAGRAFRTPFSEAIAEAFRGPGRGSLPRAPEPVPVAR
jgi:membrane glycosyltransferase